VRTPVIESTCVTVVPARTEGDKAAANEVAFVPLVEDADISRSSQRAIPTAAAKKNKPERQGAGHAETAPAGPTRPAAGEGASLNASADRTLFRWPVTTCTR
jgi:hypothetical protein